ncbi:MAG: murein biosynthesis integral membrane protein MurJ [Syntrophomonadaceae bacterium]|nr:murein biosynthesis integral membrane protein MurJ [Syntrophomonadaceae bacterium]
MSKTANRLAQAAILLIITVAISRVLGYGREVAMYYYFGINYFTDAYRAAFSIPDFLYMILAGGAIGSALIPVFSGYLAKSLKEQAWRSVSIAFNYTMTVMLFLLIPAYLFTEPLITLLVPGLPHEYMNLAVYMTHIMFVQTVFMVLNGFSMGILNSYGNFLAPAIGSLLYNIVIILIGISFVHYLGIVAFAYGVVAGAFMSFLVQIPALVKVKAQYVFSFSWRDEGFKKIIIMMIPVMIGLGVGQFNAFVTQNIASDMGAGVVTSLNLAQKIINFPQGIFAVSLASAIFPTLAALVAQKDWTNFSRISLLGIRAILIIMIPASVGLVLIGRQLIGLCFQQGNFTAEMTVMTYQVLIFYSFSIFAYACTQVIDRSFYALEDTKTPVLVGIITIAFNVAASIKLSNMMGQQGLALAYSLAGMTDILLMMTVFRVKVGRIGGRKIMSSFAAASGAAFIMALAVKASNFFLGPHLDMVLKAHQLFLIVADIGVGALVYLLVLYPFHLEEMELILGIIKKKIALGH